MAHSRWNVAAILFGAATLLTILTFIQTYSPQNIDPRMSPLQRTMTHVPFWYAWALFTPFIYRVAKQYRPKVARTRTIILVQILALIGFSILHHVFMVLFFRIWYLSEVFDIRTFSWKLVRYLQISTACYAVILWKDCLQEKRRLKRLRKTLNFQKFERLKQQFRPDFVLQSLDAIRSKILSNADEADAAITTLADSLRRNLDYSQQSLAFQETTGNFGQAQNHRQTSWMDLSNDLSRIVSGKKGVPEWLAIAGVWILLLSFFMVRDLLSFPDYLSTKRPLFVLFSCLIPAIATPWILRLSKRNPLAGKTKLVNTFRHICYSIVFVIVANFVFEALRYTLPGESEFVNQYLQLLRHPLLDLMTYWSIVVVGNAIVFAQASQREQLRIIRFELEFIRAKLQALCMQIHPHFLFNVLNSLAELVHEDVEGSIRMIDRLKSFFTITLQKQDQQQITLKEEIQFIEHYLGIQQVRFQNRLRVDIQIPEEMHRAAVPALILQPIVENAVRHAVASTQETAQIEIRGSYLPESIKLEIRDNGPGFHSTQIRRSGLGICNTRTRLKDLYGNRQQFLLQNTSPGALVTFQIPFEKI